MKTTKYYNQWFTHPTRKIKVNLKLEDKILLGIGGAFLIAMIYFISSVGSFFEEFESQKNQPQNLLSQNNNIFQDDWEKNEESFQKHKTEFEGVKRKKEVRAANQKAFDNFHEQFDKAHDNFINTYFPEQRKKSKKGE